MKVLHTTSWFLLIIGGLNWLLRGLIASWDLSTYLGYKIAMIIYILIGVAAIIELFTHKTNCKKCEVGKPAAAPPPESTGIN